jgi:ankyrin repeat protein
LEAVVRQLIKKRADLKVNYKDERSWTALSLSIENGHEVMVLQPPERRTDLDAHCRDKRGRTAPWSSAASGQEEVMKLLLEKGADTDSKDRWGRRRYNLPDGRGHETVV